MYITLFLFQVFIRKHSLFISDERTLPPPDSEDAPNEEELEHLKHKAETEAKFKLKHVVHAFKQVEYDEDAAWGYLLGKAAFDYSAVMAVMNEIKVREPDFHPRTLFDFGSGVGTAIW